MSETRAFPQDNDAEKGVLASLLLAPQDVRACCSRWDLDGRDFNLAAHRIIFETACSIVDGNGPLDIITLGSKLRDEGNLEKAGGAAYVSDLYFFVPSAANVKAYAETVLEKSRARAALQTAIRLTTELYDGSEPLEAVAAAHGALGQLLQTRTRRPNHREVLQSIVDEVREGRDDSGLVPVPMEGIHGRLKLYRGDLLIITAPTSCGKTALGTQISYSLAKHQHRIALYPLEMAQRQVMKRAIAQMGGHNADFVRKIAKENIGKPVASEYATKIVGEFVETARALAALDIHLRDDLFRWDQIRNDIRQEHARKPFTFILIDYLQLVQSNGRHERKQLQIAEITQGAKLLAGELECIVCLPSQVNKDGGTREAQDAENDASALIKIHPLEGKDEPEPGRVTVWKQREGQRHIDLCLKFNPDLTRFDYREVVP